jgi:hypothetical protein
MIMSMTFGKTNKLKNGFFKTILLQKVESRVIPCPLVKKLFFVGTGGHLGNHL